MRGPSDLSSFGAVLYEMLTGRRAFGGSGRGVLTSILTIDPPACFSRARNTGNPRSHRRAVPGERPRRAVADGCGGARAARRRRHRVHDRSRPRHSPRGGRRGRGGDPCGRRRVLVEHPEPAGLGRADNSGGVAAHGGKSPPPCRSRLAVPAEFPSLAALREDPCFRNHEAHEDDEAHEGTERAAKKRVERARVV